MKRTICALLLVCALFSLAAPAWAVEEAPAVTPRYSYILDLDYSLSINSSGVATCKASAETDSYSKTVKITCNLQYYNGSTWAILRSWSSTGSLSASLNQSQAVRSGYTDYRIKVTCSIYDSSNNLLETATKYDYDYYIPST